MNMGEVSLVLVLLAVPCVALIIWGAVCDKRAGRQWPF